MTDHLHSEIVPGCYRCDLGSDELHSSMIRLTILDEPTGKARPKFNRTSGRAYTPKKTTNAENAIRATWEAAGKPTMPADVPLHAEIALYVQRPAGHFKRDGSLSAAGERAGRSWCRKKPDADNAAKLILDALEKYAYPHDAAIALLTVAKRWTCAHPRVEVYITQAVVQLNGAA